jgi:hypothetical protein
MEKVEMWLQCEAFIVGFLFKFFGKQKVTIMKVIFTSYKPIRWKLKINFKTWIPENKEMKWIDVIGKFKSNYWLYKNGNDL